jgi:membrane-associated protein
MQYRQFIKFVFVGGALWTGGVTLAGFYLGKAIPSAHLYLTPIILLIIFISLIPAVIELIHKQVRKRKKNPNA